MVYPSVSGFAISLTAWTGVGNDFHFIGLENFREALTSWPLYRAAFHNLIMFVAILIFQHTVGLFIAVQLHARPRFMEVYRTILFLPVIISLVATGFIWTLMLSPNIGVINPLLHAVGLGFLAHSWLSDPSLALATVIAVAVLERSRLGDHHLPVRPAEHPGRIDRRRPRSMAPAAGSASAASSFRCSRPLSRR